jgi:hypothetical protein
MRRRVFTVLGTMSLSSIFNEEQPISVRELPHRIKIRHLTVEMNRQNGTGFRPDRTGELFDVQTIAAGVNVYKDWPRADITLRAPNKSNVFGGALASEVSWSTNSSFLCSTIFDIKKITTYVFTGKCSMTRCHNRTQRMLVGEKVQV